MALTPRFNKNYINIGNNNCHDNLIKENNGQTLKYSPEKLLLIDYNKIQNSEST
jgi:hypothetical protein